MSFSLLVTGHFDDPDTYRALEVQLDEEVRMFVQRLQEQFGAAVQDATLSGSYIGEGVLLSSVGRDTTPRPTLPDSDPNVGSDYIDESVVDDADGDSGLGDDAGLPGDAGAVDAGGDHPGDVLNPDNQDLAVNRSVPTVELAPNPEDQHGHDTDGTKEGGGSES